MLLISAYCLVAAAVLLAVHRMGRKVSIGAGIALVALPLLPFVVAWSTGRIVAPYDNLYASIPYSSYRQDYGVPDGSKGILTDVSGQMIPWHMATRRAFLSGRWPLWNFDSSAGEPLLASAQSAPLYWANLVSLVVPERVSFDLRLALGFWLSMSGMFFLLRYLGCRETLAIFGGCAFAFSSFLWFFSAWPMAPTFSWAPLILLGLLEARDHPGRGPCLFLSFCLAEVVFAGHPESAAHVAACSTLTALVLLVATPRGRRWAFFGCLATAALVALGLSAAFSLPVADAVVQSGAWEFRRTGAPWLALADTAYMKRALLGDLFPFLLGGNSFYPPGRPEFWAPASSLYAGSVLWPSMIAALFLVPWRRTVPWVVAAGLGVLVGAKAPLAYPLTYEIPILSSALNERLVFIAVFAVCAMAALGAEAVWRRGWFGRFGALSVGCGTLVGASLWFTRQALSNGLPTEYARRQAWIQVGFLVGLGAWLWLVGGLRRLRSHRQARDATVAALLGILLIATLSTQRWLEMSDLLRPLPKAGLFPLVPPLDSLPRDRPPYRVIGEGHALLPNATMLLNLEDARGYNAIYSRRFAETWPLWAKRPDAWFQRVEDLSAPFLNFLNVRFAVQPADRPVPAKWRRVAVARDTVLMRNTRALHQAFVPRRVRWVDDPRQTVDEMAKQRDFAEVAWIDSIPSDVPPPATQGIAENGRGRVLEIRRAGNGLEIEVAMDEPGWLVVSQTHWRGWRASTDGERMPIANANHAFIGIWAPAGSHQLRLDYRPMSAILGALVTGFTALGLVSFVAIGRRRAE